MVIFNKNCHVSTRNHTRILSYIENAASQRARPLALTREVNVRTTPFEACLSVMFSSHARARGLACCEAAITGVVEFTQVKSRGYAPDSVKNSGSDVAVPEPTPKKAEETRPVTAAVFTQRFSANRTV